MTSKKPKDKQSDGERLKLDVGWEEAAERLLNAPAKSTPPRPVKPRKKKGESSGS